MFTALGVERGQGVVAPFAFGGQRRVVRVAFGGRQSRIARFHDDVVNDEAAAAAILEADAAVGQIGGRKRERFALRAAIDDVLEAITFLADVRDG